MHNNEDFIRLAELYMDACFRLAFTFLKNREDADDVTQIALLKLYESPKSFESDAHVKNWLMAVTANECRKYWRSPWSKTESFEEYASKLEFDEERSRELFCAVMSLNAKYRSVIVLYYYEGYSIAEIGSILKLPLGTVGTRLKRARNSLREYLQEV